MKYLKNRCGEGYIDICVMIIAFVSGLVIAINVFSFITLKVEMDTIAEELIESAMKNDHMLTEDDELYKQYAINATVERVHQSMEAFVHNAEMIHSRGGRL